MPEGNFTDKDGTIRKEIRIKWWKDPSTSTYKEISIEPIEDLSESTVDITKLKNTHYYNEVDKPVFRSLLAKRKSQAI
ncbi:MAG: hypothetical protein WKF70_14370 [Chitinophagaceae bacterium]